MFDLDTIKRMNADAEKGIYPDWYKSSACTHTLIIPARAPNEVVCTQCGKLWVDANANANSKKNIS